MLLSEPTVSQPYHGQRPRRPPPVLYPTGQSRCRVGEGASNSEGHAAVCHSNVGPVENSGGEPSVSCAGTFPCGGLVWVESCCSYAAQITGPRSLQQLSAVRNYKKTSSGLFKHVYVILGGRYDSTNCGGGINPSSISPRVPPSRSGSSGLPRDVSGGWART